MLDSLPLASQEDAYLGQVEYILVQYQTMDVNPAKERKALKRSTECFYNLQANKEFNCLRVASTASSSSGWICTLGCAPNHNLG